MDVNPEIEQETEDFLDLPYWDDVLVSDLLKEEYEIYNGELSDDEKIIVGSEEKQSEERQTKDTSLKCGICGRYFEYKSFLKNHMVSHSTEKKFECAVCSKKYKSKLLILSHLKTHFKKPRSCPHCKKKFENALELQKHIRKEICWQNVAYLCKCGMFCQSRYIPHKHLESHKTYQCNSCDRKFSYEHSLIRHMNLLRTEKAFVCEICQKKFCRKSDLNVHKVSTPTCSITKCPYCAKIFEKQYLFTKHMNNQHSGLPKQPNKSLSCQICKEVFVNIADLMDHVKIHKLEDKRVICTICESIFKSKTNLEKHYKTFHKESRL